MKKDMILQAQTRVEEGSAASRRLRREGWMPLVLATHEGVVRNLKLSTHDFSLVLSHHQSESLLVDVAVDGGDPVKALVTGVQHDGLTGRVIHADLKEISMTETLDVSVSLRLAGDPVGVKEQGGTLEQMLHELEVKCRASEMVEEVVADVSGLNVGDSLRVADLAIPAGFEVQDEAETVVAIVLAPRLDAEAEEGAAGEAGAAEPEVIKKGREEEAAE
jgi:large subunit ribosomal protein L25